MTVLLDTGPLVALLNRRDQYHDWTRTSMHGLDRPLHTCEAVLAEAHHLLSSIHDGARRLNELVDSGHVDVSFRYRNHAGRVHALMSKYRDVPMAFADACVVAQSETLEHPRILTLDDDFRVYRRKRNRPLDLLTPR